MQSQCLSNFSQAASLSMDLFRSMLHKIHSKAAKLMVCPFCKARFAEKLELAIHVRYKH